MKNIRNFVIFAHIDHGKSTLADRFLEITGTVSSDKMRSQFLDMMELEREKGITIKMQPVRMTWKGCMLNLIDTPGHVDFNYEVSRSLAAVEGGILLVDATKGIQAQTLANLDLAKKQNLVVVAAANKIDLAHSQTEQTRGDIAQLLGIEKEKVFAVSGKTGLNVEELLQAVIDGVPAPEGDAGKPLKALIFDSKYDSFKGVIAYVRLFDGEVKAGEKIRLLQAKADTQVKEVGYFSPELKPCGELRAGEIGYIATGVKEASDIRVGETITLAGASVEPLPGYREPKPMVFASIYPEDPNDFEVLFEAFKKLKLNDASLVFEKERKEFLGRGFRCGFLGNLHAEIICERLKREFGLELIISTPSVVYKIVDKKNNEQLIYSAGDWPDASSIGGAQEPWVRVEIITPLSYLGSVSELLKDSKAVQIENRYLGQERLILIYEMPLRKIVVGFFDRLKGVSQGFASMNYEVTGYRPADLVRLDILIAGQREDVFSRVVDKSEAYSEGRKMVSKLKEIVPPQLFAVPVQAAISGKIIARETIKARRRDVTAPLYGGDVTRKRKLLERQKKGKKKMRERGQVSIPSEVFLEMFKEG